MDGKEQDKAIKLFYHQLILLVSYFKETYQCTIRNVSIPAFMFSCTDIHFKGTKAELMWKDP